MNVNCHRQIAVKKNLNSAKNDLNLRVRSELKTSLPEAYSEHSQISKIERLGSECTSKNTYYLFLYGIHFVKLPYCKELVKLEINADLKITL